MLKVCCGFEALSSCHDNQNAVPLCQNTEAAIEELGAKTAKVTIFSDFLKYWEIWFFFSQLHCILG